MVIQGPGLFGGSKRKSEEHLRRALAYNPRSILTRIFLAETLEALDRPREAIAELRQVSSCRPIPIGCRKTPNSSSRRGGCSRVWSPRRADYKAHERRATNDE